MHFVDYWNIQFIIIIYTILCKELSVIVQRWRYRRLAKRCWQWKVLVFYCYRLFYTLAIKLAWKRFKKILLIYKHILCMHKGMRNFDLIWWCLEMGHRSIFAIRWDRDPGMTHNYWIIENMNFFHSSVAGPGWKKRIVKYRKYNIKLHTLFVFGS